MTLDDSTRALLLRDDRDWPLQVSDALLPDGRRVTARILPQRRTWHSKPPTLHPKGGFRAECTTRYEGWPKARSLTCRVYPVFVDGVRDWHIEFEQRPRNNVKRS